MFTVTSLQILVQNLSNGPYVKVRTKGVGPSTTLAWPGWSSLIFQWKLTRADSKLT